MAARQRTDEADHEAPGNSFWARYTRPLSTTAGQALMAATFLGLVSAAAISLWGRFREQILAAPEFVVTAQDIHIPESPPWIRIDIKSEAITSGSLENLTVRQNDLQRRVAAAFEMHPWVAEVRRVTTRYPGQVFVDLAFRRPIAMVYVEVVRQDGPKQGLYPVDPEGTWLPVAGFTGEEALNFPRIVVDKTPPSGGPGSPWGDTRVHGAAKIALHLEKVWHRLGLSTIVAHADHTGLKAPSTVYELQTNDGTSIIWGHSPGDEEHAEPRAPHKVQRLLRFADQQGSLTVAPGERIDLRQPDRLSVVDQQDLDISLQ